MTDALVEQLWGGPMSDDQLRIHWAGRGDRGSRDENAWREVERYYVVPGASRPTMLLPAGPRPALLGALDNYRGLRTARRQLQRRAISSLAAINVLPSPQIVLSIRPDEPEDSRVHPLGELSAALGRRDLRASIGVRTGANRKATLQLVDVSGSPVGFAKFAWSRDTAVAVETETAALTGDDHLGICRRPALLASGSYGGWPYLVSSPLPLSCRGVRGRVHPPTVHELHDLAPVTGRRPLGTSQQLRRLTASLESLASTGSVAALVTGTLRLLDEHVRARPVVTSDRWHGDLTPWNSARDAEDRLWVWDWESSEADAVAGMDAIHWHLSLVQEAGRPLTSDALAGAVEAAAPVLTGLGHASSDTAVVTAVYVASMVERAVTLSIAQGWEAGWLTPRHLEDLVGHAARGLRSAGITPS